MSVYDDYTEVGKELERLYNGAGEFAPLRVLAPMYRIAVALGDARRWRDQRHRRYQALARAMWEA